MHFILRRAYEAASPEDDYRLLVDRLWPRGVKKHDLQFDEWLKTLAPTPELRRWFGHDPQRWREFSHAYQLELESKQESIDSLLLRCRDYHQVCLIYAAKDPHFNHAQVLKAYLESYIN